MPIIMDGKTPEGRVVKCRKSDDSATPCRTRKMTEEERKEYGDPVPPKYWGKPPLKSEYWVKTPQRRAIEFKNNEDFCRWMKRERLRKNMTQKRLADFAGIGSDYISKVERGVKESSEEMKRKICDVFGWEMV